jgi:hypothetical protein
MISEASQKPPATTGAPSDFSSSGPYQMNKQIPSAPSFTEGTQNGFIKFNVALETYKHKVERLGLQAFAVSLPTMYGEGIANLLTVISGDIDRFANPDRDWQILINEFGIADSQQARAKFRELRFQDITTSAYATFLEDFSNTSSICKAGLLNGPVSVGYFLDCLPLKVRQHLEFTFAVDIHKIDIQALKKTAYDFIKSVDSAAKLIASVMDITVPTRPATAGKANPKDPNARSRQLDKSS